MAGQIRFFDKNLIDLDNQNAQITVTDATAVNDGADFVDFMRNRNNTSAWLTTGSNDAANTTLEIDLVDERLVGMIILLWHNFKEYTIDYWNGSSYVNFVTVTANTSITTFHEPDSLYTTKLRITIQGTMVADADKSMRQLIITNGILTGQLNGWPVIKSPQHFTNRKVTNMLSGKVNVVETVGGFGCSLDVKNWNSDSDLSIVEEVYFGKRGVLVWLSGGDDTQFSRRTVGYRNEDIYFMRCVNDYSPALPSGIYTTGLAISLKLREAKS